jgi:hypothetical protein
MVENWRSSGVATAVAIVSGLAPGRLAETLMVGKSTLGRSLTGSSRYESAPKSNTPSITSVVATGRRMNGSEMFTGSSFVIRDLSWVARFSPRP